MKKHIDELIRFLPVFDAPDFVDVIRWEGGGRSEDGAYIASWPVYAPEVAEFFTIVSRPPWTDYDYDPVVAGGMIRDTGAVESADIEQIRSMLTWAERSERFCPGHWESVLEEGLVQALLRRLEVIRRDME